MEVYQGIKAIDRLINIWRITQKSCQEKMSKRKWREKKWMSMAHKKNDSTRPGFLRVEKNKLT